jgi:hypothetical protein
LSSVSMRRITPIRSTTTTEMRMPVHERGVEHGRGRVLYPSRVRLCHTLRNSFIGRESPIPDADVLRKLVGFRSDCLRQDSIELDSKDGKSRPITGGFFLRENSSNGGKAIRTFWLHSRCGWRRCQGKIGLEISGFKSITYQGLFRRKDVSIFYFCSPCDFRILSGWVEFCWGFMPVFHRT